jgi:peptide/nickel transport system substrate-binding protein
MSRSKILLLLVAALAAVLVVVPAAAQESVARTGTFGDGPSTLSQVYCTDTACADIVGYMYLGLVGVDPETQTIIPGEDALAANWDVSEDNMVYTVTLREDAFWSDGEQINADDVLFHWDLLNNPDAAHPDAFLLDSIENVEKIDDFTVEFTMSSPACSALNFIGGVTPVAEHVYSQYDPTELNTISEVNSEPSVFSGPFTLGQYRPGETVTLLTNPDYIDAPEEIGLDGFIQDVFTDQIVLIEALLEEEVNFLEGIPATQQNRIREQSVDNGGNLQIYEYPGNSWDYMGFNLADPNNPQPALDEDGNRVDQGLHPIFSDKSVRHAIGHAVNVDEIIEGALFGNGSRMPAQITPSSWAFNEELTPRPFDVATAEQLLDKAGWVMGDDGVRVCDGCLYAEEVDPDFAGSPFEFTLFTNAGNDRREAIGTIMQDQLSDVGIVVDFQTLEFNTLLDIMDSQEFDAFILGWRAGYPDDPNTIQLFGEQADVPGSGFNFTSFYNEEYFELEQQANTVAGCAQEERGAIYAEMQEIMYDEMPYLWLFSQNGMYAATDSVNNFDPFPSNIDWNLLEWAVTAE